jgi:hypothetical protein
MRGVSGPCYLIVVVAQPQAAAEAVIRETASSETVIGHIGWRQAGHVLDTAASGGANVEAIVWPKLPVYPIRSVCFVCQIRIVFGPPPAILDVAPAAAIARGASHQWHPPSEFTDALAEVTQGAAPAIGRTIPPAAVTRAVTVTAAVARAIAVAAAWAILEVVAVVIGGRAAVIGGRVAISARTPVIGRVVTYRPAGRKASCFLRCALLIHW